MAVRTFLLPQPYRHDASAIRFLRHQVPRDAVVQGDPTTRVNLPQLVNRQMGVLDPKNSHVRVFFPKDEERMRRVFAMVEQAFSTYSSRQAYDNLRCARVTHVLAGSVERQRFGDLSQFDDPAWFERIYRDQHACVYRLRKVSEALATPKPGQRCRDTLREYEITHVFAGCIEIKRWKGIEERYGIRYFRALFESPHASVFTLK